MANEIQIEGESYVPSKQAAQISGYSQDYIGQLARGGLIKAQRIGGLWYISMQSLSAHKEKAEQYVPQPPQLVKQDTDAIVSFEGKEYISASRASEISGYHGDYVGQLARSGKVASRQIGNRWYVAREDLMAHKAQKDSLLAAVQAESVGIRRPESRESANESTPPLFTYTSHDGPLLPQISSSSHIISETENQYTAMQDTEVAAPEMPEPHRRGIKKGTRASHMQKRPRVTPRAPTSGKTIFFNPIRAAIMLGVVAIMATATLYFSLHSGKIVAHADKMSLQSSAKTGITRIGDSLEPLLTRELIYERAPDVVASPN